MSSCELWGTHLLDGEQLGLDLRKFRRNKCPMVNTVTYAPILRTRAWPPTFIHIFRKSESGRDCVDVGALEQECRGTVLPAAFAHGMR